MEQNKSTQSWPYPGQDFPEPGEMHLRVYPDGWDLGRTSEVACLATRLIDSGWSVGVGLCSTPSHDFMNTARITWGHAAIEAVQVRDLVDLAKLVYKVSAKHAGPRAIIVDDWVRPDTGIARGHDDAVMVEVAEAIMHGDLNALYQLSGLNYATYTGDYTGGEPMALVAGTRFRAKGTALSDVMGGLITLQQATSVVSFYDPVYSGNASVTCEVRALKTRTGQLIEPTQITRTASGMWRKGSVKDGFS